MQIKPRCKSAIAIEGARGDEKRRGRGKEERVKRGGMETGSRDEEAREIEEIRKDEEEEGRACEERKEEMRKQER